MENEKNKSSYYISVWLTLALVLLLALFPLYFLNNKVNAESIDNALLNFNQLYKPNYTTTTTTTTNNITYLINDYNVQLNGTATANTWVNLKSTIGMIKDNIYLISNVNNGLSGFNGLTLFIDGSRQNSTILDSIENWYLLKWTGENLTETIYLQCANNSTYNNANLNLQIINLTQMFGNGNEPTINECDDIFITNYYYTNSFYLSNDNLYYYTQGVNSVNKSLIIGEAVSDWINNTYSCDASEFVKDENGTLGWTNGTIATKLNYTLSVGDTVNMALDIYTDTSDSNLIIGQLDDNGNFIQLISVDWSNWEYSAPGGTLGVYSGNISFNIKYNTNQLMFRSTGNIINCKKIEYITYNYDNQLANAFEQGKKSVNTDYYYNLGLQQGIAQGQATGSAWGNSWEFISSAFNGLGSILSVEILPNLPLYTFIAIPLLFGLITLIYKLIGG